MVKLSTLLKVKLKGVLVDQIKNNAEDKEILGVFREPEGMIETLSINDNYFKIRERN
ncbi:MAG: hypothetical protein ACK5LM_04625 [Lactovum sp.]